MPGRQPRESSATRTWYARLAAASATEMRGPHFRQWVDRLEAEIDNLRLALTWALLHAPLMALQAAVDLAEFWLVGVYPREGHRWIDRALARAEERPATLPRFAARARAGASGASRASVG